MLTCADFPYSDPIEVFEPLRDHPFALLIHGRGKRWSYICAAPLVKIKQTNVQPNPFGGIEEINAQLAFERPQNAPPFCGGWAGLLSYELGKSLLPKLDDAPQAVHWPDMAVGLYDQVLVFDHKLQTATIFNWDWSGRLQRVAVEERNISLIDLLRAKADLPDWTASLVLNKPSPKIAAVEYEKLIARTVAYIHAGDCFQSNISQVFDFELNEGAHPYHLIKRLDRTSGAPFSAFFRLDELALASNSPERFLKTRPDANGSLIVTTKPIKGTRPRGRNQLEDDAYALDLKTSEKDLAENLMIVDLMRNDLAKASVPGSVKVPALNALESYANVHHLVSTIESRLAPGNGPFQVLKGAFPGGSVTGAPKIRAMQIIAEMEGVARGPYCGSLVWVSPDGWMDSSILIRSTAFRLEEDLWIGEYRVGGGIVADSDPHAEYQETLDKGMALYKALIAGAENEHI